MTRFARGLTIFVVGALCGAVGGYAVEHRHELGEQWALYQLIRAEDPAVARGQLAWFDTEPRRQAKLGLLVSRWGTAGPRFDEHLARFVARAGASEELRRTFAEELRRRPEWLPRWAEYWAWKSRLGPADETESVLRYLGTLAQATPPRSITWREVLDAQATLTLLGRSDLAGQVTADAWHEAFREWEAAADSPTSPRPGLTRPAHPFSNWQGPPPPREE